MSIQNFQQTIWSKKFNQALETITSLRNHCDFKYEAESKNAKEVKILNVVRPTIRTYVPGTALTREGATDGSMTLKINQFKYFDFEVDDVDEAQSVPGLMDELTREASRGLAEEGDKYVASLVKAGVEAETDALAQSSSVITLSKSNAVRSVEDGFAVLYGNNCKVSDMFYLEVAPKPFTIYREALTELSTNNPEILKKGAVGKINNAYVCIENLLPTGKSSSTATSDDVHYNILRTSKAIAFAEQINKVEAYRPQDAFSDALKGLYTFGALITRPQEIYVIKTAI
ncbi:MAG TPA: hypothetical protein DCE23_04150 [Firmicutes bacterium]|nr:hypothetical protein [Bacillota bacterium]